MTKEKIEYEPEDIEDESPADFTPGAKIPDTEDTTREVINTSSKEVKFVMDRQTIVMKPNEIRRIPKAYAIERQLQPNAPALVPVVQHLTGNKVLPLDHPKAAAAVEKARAGGYR